jgi:hypothetical protein
MDPFPDYRQVFPAQARHCPLGGCATCCGLPALVHREFAALVNRSWSLAERNILRQAARSALL